MPKIERPEKFDGKRAKWKAFKCSFESYLSIMKTAQGIPYKYVINLKTPKVEQADDASTIATQATSLNAELYDSIYYVEDNHFVYHEL